MRAVPVVIVDRPDQGRVGELCVRMPEGRTVIFDGVGETVLPSIEQRLGKRRPVVLASQGGDRALIGEGMCVSSSWAPAEG